MFTSGVGSLVDLPNISVLVQGLDDWTDVNLPDLEPIEEPRLVDAVRKLAGLARVEELRPAPWMDGEERNPRDPAWRVGVPTVPFPSWLRCTACNELATIESRTFAFENSRHRRPQDARFFHPDCPRKRSGRPPLAVAARFVLSCSDGHLDNFPHVEYVHRGATCPDASGQPRMRMTDRGGNIGANVVIRCLSCGAERNIRQVLGKGAEEHLPRCRGRHPHLARFDEDCERSPQLIVIGASNQWFPKTLSALQVPKAGSTRLAALVDEHWESVLKKIERREMLPFTRGLPLPQLRDLVEWSDDELWAAIEAHRATLEGDDDGGYPDLLTPEWEIFTSGDQPTTRNFTLRHVEVPSDLKDAYSDVAQVERLREVRALVGFTRLDAPDPEDPEAVTLVPLSRGEPRWVPASDVRGEGIFLRIPEPALAEWEQRLAASASLREHRDAYQQFREKRHSERLSGPFDPMAYWPGTRYIALHTLSHLLIRTIALECGYSAASLSERIYSGDKDDPRGGILIYTAVPDAEGTLGGLVSQAEPERLVRLTRLALRDAQRCSSDPLCAGRTPHDDFLHGAACHVCLFVSETTCERGNRFLDRRFVVPLGGHVDLALYRDLP